VSAVFHLFSFSPLVVANAESIVAVEILVRMMGVKVGEVVTLVTAAAD